MRKYRRSFMNGERFFQLALPARKNLGSIGLPTVTERAQAAVTKYQSLMARLNDVNNAEAQLEIRNWLGDSNTPGTPAERYGVVEADLMAGQPDPTLQAKRVSDLESLLADFESRVAGAEAAYGTSTDGQIAGSGLSGNDLAMLALAAVSLFVLPFVLE